MGNCGTGVTVCSGGALDCSQTVFPSNEVCDNADNDCDGSIDEGVTTTFYRDADGDGFGASAMTQTGCTPPAGYVGNALDCDDTTAVRNPAAPEVCDGVDNNCNGISDEGDPGGGGTCGTAVGECVAGTERCDQATGTIIWAACRFFGWADRSVGWLDRPVRRPDLWAIALECRNRKCGWRIGPDGHAAWIPAISTPTTAVTLMTVTKDEPRR